LKSRKAPFCARLGAVATLMFALGLSCGRGPQRLSRDTYSALERAIGAMERANEYRDAGVLLLEPRLLDAEKAVADIPDRMVSQEIGRCLTELNTYRQWLGLASDEDRLSRDGNKSAGARLDKSLSEATGAGIRLNVCVGKLRASYLE